MRQGAIQLDIAMESDLVFYGLRTKPFEPAVDPRFLWLGARHRQGLDRLRLAIERYAGLTVLTGEVGVGKTTLANALIAQLGEAAAVASLGYPRLDPIQFFRLVARGYRLDTTADSREELLAQLQRFLAEARRTGRKVVLVLDEAQVLTPALFGEIRRLCGIGGRDPDARAEGVLSILLVGQQELAGPLPEPELMQRVVLRWVVEPLTPDEVGAYIAHRLAVAGSARNPFSPEAVHEVWALSGGIPRAVNALCARALVLGGRAMAMGSRCASLTIGPGLVREAASGLRAADQGPGPGERGRKAIGAGRGLPSRPRRRAAAIAVGLTLLALAGAAAGYLRSSGQQASASRADVGTLAAEPRLDAEAPEPVARPPDGPAGQASEAAAPAADPVKPGKLITARPKGPPPSARAGKPAGRREMTPAPAGVRPAESARAPRVAPPPRPAANGQGAAQRPRAASVPPPPVPAKDQAAEPDPAAVIDWLLDEYAGKRD